ncbi:hypothetical protein [Pseudanabaena minima]|uniref:hypothetical protein n=1 Tax=Pseudanabaena minima TaxID=890415 RepID=UPI003DA970D8
MENSPVLINATKDILLFLLQNPQLLGSGVALSAILFAVQFYLVFKVLQLDKKINVKVDTLGSSIKTLGADVDFIKNRSKILSFEEALCMYTLYTGHLSFLITEWVMTVKTNPTITLENPETFATQIAGTMQTKIEESREHLRLFYLINGQSLADLLEEANASKRLFANIQPSVEGLRQGLSSKEDPTLHIQRTLSALLLKFKLDAKENFTKKLKEIYGKSSNLGV